MIQLKIFTSKHVSSLNFQTLKLEDLPATHLSSINVSIAFPIPIPFSTREAFIYSRRTTYSNVTCYLPTPIWELMSYRSGQSNPTTLRCSCTLTHMQIKRKKEKKKHISFCPIWQSDLMQQLSCRLATTTGKLKLWL